MITLMTCMSPFPLIQAPHLVQEERTTVSTEIAELSSTSEFDALATTMAVTVPHTVFAETTVEGTMPVEAMERGYA